MLRINSATKNPLVLCSEVTVHGVVSRFSFSVGERKIIITSVE
jgi:hypothetical protein